MARLRPCWWLLATLVGLSIVYHPVLGWGPVAEDFQFALKGAKVSADPSEILQPLQLVWRPLAVLPFALLAGPSWLPMRATQCALGLVLATLGFVLMRRVVRVPAPAAALLILLWLLAPLSSEVLCGETAFIGHLLYGCATLTALLALASDSPRSRWVQVAAVCVALLSKEDAVVLPLVLFLAAWLVVGRPLRAATFSGMLAAAPVALYLPAYAAITRLGYRGFFEFSITEVIAKTLVTGGSFLHVLPPTGSRFVAHLTARPWQAALTVLMLVALPLILMRSRQREALGWLLITAVLLLPTLPSAGQAARWTFLPWLAFLAACGHAFAKHAFRERRWPARVAIGLASVLIVTNSVVTLGDVRDWGRFEDLTRRLEGELELLKQATHAGIPIVVWRDEDSAPLTELLFNPAGGIKLYFPRPEDPYGIVSLEAMLGWHLHREGLAVLRVPEPAPGSLVLSHRDGGFLPLHSPSRIGANRRDGTPRPPICLVPIDWRDHPARTFP